MTDARGKEEGICAGLGLSHEPLWDGGSTHTHTNKDVQTYKRTGFIDNTSYLLRRITTWCSVRT